MGLQERIKKFDSHSSVSKEYRVYTAHGAVLSVMTVLIIMYLVLSEVRYNFQMNLRENVHVNATTSRGLEMEFDITLWNVPCSKLQIDANDHMGQPQSLHLDKQHHVWKHRLMRHEDGEVDLIGYRSKLELGSTLLNEKDLVEIVKDKVTNKTIPISDEEEITCGSCYGAGEEDECCNTCEDIQRAYKTRGWHLELEPGHNIIPCIGVKSEEDDDTGEGCNVHGVVALSSGGGNLHLAPGKDAAASGGAMNILEALMQSFQEWNVSHTLNKLRFGPEYPAAKYQLDGQVRTVEDTFGMYQYYLQIVPTLYKFKNGTTIQTNQYSVTEHLRHVNPGSNRGLPGVFFFYDVSPLHVEIVEGYRKGWIAFFTSVCAIVGGVVTVMGMIDQLLYTSKQKRPSELMR